MRIEVAPIIGEAPLHNLISSAVMLEPDGANRWENGITWQQDGCLGAYSYRQVCDEEDPDLTGSGEPGGIGTNDPNTYYLPYDCYAGGFRDNDVLKSRLEKRLEVAAVKAFEADFWVTLQNNTPNVSGNASGSGIINQGATTSPVPVSPEVALLDLSQALANCASGARGMIHAPVYLVEAWALRNYLTERDGKLVTRARGDIVVAGSGYTGLGPVGNPAETTLPTGTAWAYASAMVGVRQSETRFIPQELFEALSRSDNIVRWHAERSISAQVDACCAAAVLVDVP